MKSLLILATMHPTFGFVNGQGKTMKLSSILFFLITAQLFAQNEWAGRYVNLQNNRNALEVYVPETSSVIMNYTSYYSEDDKASIYRSRSIFQNDTVFGLAGPFETFEKDAYFFRRGGVDYYFKHFEYEMSGDSLGCLYKKVAEMPTSWKLTPEERIGENGLVGRNLKYIIDRIDDVEYSDSPLLKEKLIVKTASDRTFVLDRSMLHTNEAFLGQPFKVSQLFGKVLKFSFIHENGYSSGYGLSEETPEELRREIPYQISMVKEIGSTLSKEQVYYPTAWVQNDLSDQFTLITYANFDDSEGTMDLHVDVRNKQDESVHSMNYQMYIVGETAVFDKVPSMSHITNVGVDEEYQRWTSTIIVTDFNFDGLHDIAIMTDEGGHSGSKYSYYIQIGPNIFEINQTLTEIMRFAPTTLDRNSNSIHCSYSVGSSGLVEMILKYDPKVNDWKVIKNEYTEFD